MEHERFQDLHRKYERMQEDYEKQLKAAEESRKLATEELTQQYEAKLQEKTQILAQVSQKVECEEAVTPHKISEVFWSTLILSFSDFAQCQDDTQQQIREYKEIIRQVEEDEESMIRKITINYEKKLHTEKETNTNLNGEIALLTQKVSNSTD